ncbi:phage virion morphogenesis protein [Acerihabitans sp. TG2]|uniref:phage virion morphogenesis protein n=1 Tax=Acerihabitans sp. TG2 TaxID=3096008 RepID=UPI002B237ECC|nr:phage virion morphogenesis protein [Acerihabitans sp. TG2]MEA9393486.1 phage virion morphogenesis protein [Acerihabitans sp. TG2]
MNELEQFDQRLEGLIAALSPQARKTMAVTIAKKLRTSQQQRIKRQKAPDGTPYVPRKAQPLRKKQGRVKREMFSKLRTNRYMKAKGDSNSAVVEFTGRVQRMARVHHYGLRDRPSSKGVDIQYTERQLMGLNKDDQSRVNSLITDNLYDLLY